jgi:hypothetical protein
MGLETPLPIGRALFFVLWIPADAAHPQVWER